MRRPAFGRRRRLSLALALAAALAAPVAGASTYLDTAPAVMVDKADLIFVATVADVHVTLQQGQPWTTVRFEVETALKGVADAGGDLPGTVDLDFLGGQPAGAPSLTVSGMPAYTRGERVLVMAYDQHYASPLVGFRQGLWRVDARGLTDTDGRLLSVDAGGALLRGGDGAPLERVLEAIRQRLAGPEGAP
jgi:hypothetical protein